MIIIFFFFAPAPRPGPREGQEFASWRRVDPMIILTNMLLISWK